MIAESIIISPWQQSILALSERGAFALLFEIPDRCLCTNTLNLSKC